ncbi:MAG: hypothetical protein V1837_02960 [Candidatus Woesearchaeota archaeon]
MKLVKPVQDFDFQSVDGNLQYAMPQGSLEQQQKVFVAGGFSWLPAVAVREIIADNPEFWRNWYRNGTGADYAHHEGGAIKLYLSPSNRILTAKGDAFDKALGSIRKTGNIPLDRPRIDALVLDAQKNDAGIYVIDVDVLQKNNKWVSDNREWGHLVISTKDYAKQMQDSPDLAALVTPLYGTGVKLDRTMSQIRQRSRETLAFVLLPTYVRLNAPEGTGLARLSALYYFNYFSDAIACGRSIDDSVAFAFGVRQRTAEGGCTENRLNLKR